MSIRLIRTLLALEFLVAIEVWLTFWSEVAGQYDLDLMFWVWKFALILAAAGLTVGLTAELLRAAPRWFSRRAGIYLAGLILVIIAAGAVTRYTWLNEPQDDDGGDDPAAIHATQLYLPPPGSRPINYLLRTGHIEFRHCLFKRVQPAIIVMNASVGGRR